MTRQPIPQAVKQAVRDKYAWPGGYPLHLVMDDCECLCVKCARENWRGIAWPTVTGQRDGWRAVGAEINWEDPDLMCAHCGQRIRIRLRRAGSLTRHT